MTNDEADDRYGSVTIAKTCHAWLEWKLSAFITIKTKR